MWDMNAKLTSSPVGQAGDLPYDVRENGSSVKFLVTISKHN
jgi:hypothetical protein